MGFRGMHALQSAHPLYSCGHCCPGLLFAFSSLWALLLSCPWWLLLTLSSQSIYFSMICIHTSSYSINILWPQWAITSAAPMQNDSRISILDSDLSCKLQSPFSDCELGASSPKRHSSIHTSNKICLEGKFYIFSYVPISVTAISILLVA